MSLLLITSISTKEKFLILLYFQVNRSIIRNYNKIENLNIFWYKFIVKMKENDDKYLRTNIFSRTIP